MKRLIIACWLSILLSVLVVISGFTAYAEVVSKKIPLQKGFLQQINKHFSTQATTYNDGSTLVRHIINSPSKPPAGYGLQRSTVNLPVPSTAMAMNTLTVPAFDWVFGCSSVSGAMIAGYYDRNGFPNIYTGPTNGGVMPLDNSSWGTWTDSNGDTYPNLPLAASHNGVDGRTTKGSIDDYWIEYDSAASDPYITGKWTQHTWSDAIGDYMKTSQSAYDNTDGSTTFWGFNSSAKLTCSTMKNYGISESDGTYGRKLFYEARGYTVTDCYSQATNNKYSGGFSFAQFKAEIDAGRPVMLNLEGHTIVGVGYDDSSNTVYIHDTWDYGNHTMTWGGSYSGMQLYSVSIVNMQATTVTQPNLTPYQPAGWSDKIVVSNTTGTINDTTPFYTTDSLYVDWSVINNGTTSTTSTFYTTLYVDDVAQNTWYTDSPLGINQNVQILDYSIGALSAGDHTIRIVTDATGTITESNEADNEYTRTITVSESCSNLPVRRGSISYSTLQDAYDEALDGDTIQSQAVVVGTDLNLNRNVSVTIKGGYDCDYSTNDQKSKVNGPVTIRSGTVTIENVIIQ